jgi:hypothetical protein
VAARELHNKQKMGFSNGIIVMTWQEIAMTDREHGWNTPLFEVIHHKARQYATYRIEHRLYSQHWA